MFDLPSPPGKRQLNSSTIKCKLLHVIKIIPLKTSYPKKEIRVSLPPAGTTAGPSRLRWPYGYGGAVGLGPFRREGSLFRCFFKFC